MEEEEEDKLPLALAMDAGSVVEFEGVAVLEQGGGGDVGEEDRRSEESVREAWWL